MTTVNRALGLIIAIAATLGAGYAAHFLLNQSAPGPNQGITSAIGPVQVQGHWPSFNLPDLEGHPRSSAEWQGKVVVLNFWATWCPPCLREMPDFIELQKIHGAQGLQFIGIAIDSGPDVRAFAEEMGVNYPILLGETDAISLSQSLGNRFSGLPFSAVFNRSGKLIHTQAGELDRSTLEEIAIPLL